MAEDGLLVEGALGWNQVQSTLAVMPEVLKLLDLGLQSTLGI